MLKFEQIENYKHSIKILLRRKNLWFLRCTNLNTKPIYVNYSAYCLFNNLAQKPNAKNK